MLVNDWNQWRTRDSATAARTSSSTRSLLTAIAAARPGEGRAAVPPECCGWDENLRRSSFRTIAPVTVPPPPLGTPSPVVGGGHAADPFPHLVARVEGVLVQRSSVDGLQVGDELFMARRPEEDAADERPRDDPPQRELDEGKARLLRDAAQALDRVELDRVPVAVPVHAFAEPGAGPGLVLGPTMLARQQPARERVVGEGAKSEALRAGGILRLHPAGEQVVHLLPEAYGGPRPCLREVLHLGHLPGGEVRLGDVAHLAGTNHVVKGRQ